MTQRTSAENLKPEENIPHDAIDEISAISLRLARLLVGDSLDKIEFPTTVFIAPKRLGLTAVEVVIEYGKNSFGLIEPVEYDLTLCTYTPDMMHPGFELEQADTYVANQRRGSVKRYAELSLVSGMMAFETRDALPPVKDPYYNFMQTVTDFTTYLQGE